MNGLEDRGTFPYAIRACGVDLAQPVLIKESF